MGINTQQGQPAPSPQAGALRQLDTSERAPDQALSKEPEGTGLKNNEEQLSPKFAALARKEKLLRSKYQELKAREEALKAKETEYQTSYIPKSALKERLAEDPLGFLNEYDLSYDQIAQAALNAPTSRDPMVDKLLKKVAELEEKHSATATKITEQQEQAYTQALTQIRNEAKLLIDGNQAYELVKDDPEGVEAVVELIEQTFKEQGVLLSVEEAALEVENHLLEDGLKKARLKKVQQKLLEASNPAGETGEEGSSGQAQSLADAVKSKTGPQPKLQAHSIQSREPQKTLTHAVQASSKPLSTKDRIERAKLAFMGQLT